MRFLSYKSPSVQGVKSTSVGLVDMVRLVPERGRIEFHAEGYPVVLSDVA